jgi:molybdopterin converting factor small subunit
MKTITVQYFAAFREAAGIESEAVETGAGSPGELFRERALVHDGLLSYQAALVAINDEMSDWDSSIDDGDSILFFPPVAGG